MRNLALPGRNHYPESRYPEGDSVGLAMVKVRPRDVAGDDTPPLIPPEDPSGFWICPPCTHQRPHELGAGHTIDRRLESLLGDEQGCATVAWRFRLLSPVPLEIRRIPVNAWNDAWIDLALLDADRRQPLSPPVGHALGTLRWAEMPAGRYTLQASSRLWRASALRLHLVTPAVLAPLAS